VHGYAATEDHPDCETLISGCPGVPLTAHA
jgi:hypothetical protein